MPNGLTGTTGYDLTAGVDTLIHTATKTTTVTVSFCNRSSVATAVRLATGSGASPADTDYYEYDSELKSKAVIERGGIVLSTGDKVWVRSSVAGTTAKIHGI